MTTATRQPGDATVPQRDDATPAGGGHLLEVQDLFVEFHTREGVARVLNGVSYSVDAGETLAVLGASGGVGLAAIEIGKAMGARVIACASSADKLAFAKERGADEGIDYASDDLKDALRRVTGGKGVDVIYDPVGGAYTEPALRSIAWQGRFLVVGFAAGDIPKLPLNLVLLKGCDVLGVFWGSFIERDLAGHRANTAQIMQWCLDGKVSSHIHAVYPLSDAPAALNAIAARKVMGKVILRP